MKDEIREHVKSKNHSKHISRIHLCVVYLARNSQSNPFGLNLTIDEWIEAK